MSTSSEYYSLEKAAEVLGLPTAEINRLREKSMLRAFRDGSAWKFRKVDVDNYLAEMIKNRSKSEPVDMNADDSDFDLLSMDDDGEEMPTLLADSASFDSLMEDGLSLGDDMIDADASAQKKDADDGLSLADDDDLVLGEDGLSLGGNSGLILLEKDDKKDKVPAAKIGGSESDVDLADDALLLDDNGSSAQLDLAGDSGLSLLDVADDMELQSADQGGSDIVLELADDDDILSLVDDDESMSTENTSTISIPVDEDFQLTPEMDGMTSDSDSDSASQVIALDEDNMFGSPIEPDTGDIFGGAAPVADTPAVESPFAMSAAPEGEFVSSAPSFAAAPTSTEAHYSAGVVISLICVAALLILPGMMLVDLMIHIWSWGEPFVINSATMDMVCGMVGLK